MFWKHYIIIIYLDFFHIIITIVLDMQRLLGNSVNIHFFNNNIQSFKKKFTLSNLLYIHRFFYILVLLLFFNF